MNRLSVGVLLSGVALLTPRFSLVAQAPAAPTAFVIRGARVFDGVRDRGVTDVLVSGDHVAAVGKAIKAPPGAAEIDGRGKTLLPGLIDAHVHTFGDALRTALVFGSTTQLDQFTDVKMAEDSIRRGGYFQRLGVAL